MSYKPESILPTQAEPFAGDLLDRKLDIDFISKIISESAEGIVIAINAEWGAGKSWFVKSLEANLVNNGNACMFINAWESDYNADPLAAIASQFYRILEGFQNKKLKTRLIKEFKLLGKSALKSTSSNIGKQLNKALNNTSLGAVDIVDILLRYESLKSKTLHENVIEYENYKVFVAEFRSLISQIVEEYLKEKSEPKFVIIVDELDRCRPSYSIELLERVKHLFEVNNVIFIFSTNLEQLSMSVGTVYGEKFNGYEYLKRFFNIVYDLPSLTQRSFIVGKFKQFGLGELTRGRSDEFAVEESQGYFLSTFTSLSQYFDLSLRSCEQALMRTKIILNSYKSNLDSFAIALMVILEQKDSDILSKLVKRETSIVEFFKSMSNSAVGRRFLVSTEGVYLAGLLHWTHDLSSDGSWIEAQLRDYANFLVAYYPNPTEPGKVMEDLQQFYPGFRALRLARNDFQKWFEIVKLSSRLD